MKTETYSEFLESLTGTDAVEDAQKVRKWVRDPIEPVWMDMRGAFLGLLIDARRNNYDSHLTRYAEDEAFHALVYDFDDLERCGRLIGVWILRRKEPKLEKTDYFKLTPEEREYAYAFALELILPENVVRNSVKSLRMNQIAEMFAVPADVLYRRLKELDLL